MKLCFYFRCAWYWALNRKYSVMIDCDMLISAFIPASSARTSSWLNHQSSKVLPPPLSFLGSKKT